MDTTEDSSAAWRARAEKAEVALAEGQAKIGRLRNEAERLGNEVLDLRGLISSLDGQQ